jgi:hypothetical protein
MYRGGRIDELAFVLDSGVKVALMHGDRDGRCNWFGGEAISLAIRHKEREAFRQAGYAELKTNNSYLGGLVRQYGFLSFTNVFQAGHAVPYYQPETAWEVFRRVTSNLDIATGRVIINSKERVYSSKGPASALGYKQKLPPMPKTICYLLSMVATCSDAEEESIRGGKAVIQNYIIT